MPLKLDTMSHSLCLFPVVSLLLGATAYADGASSPGTDTQTSAFGETDCATYQPATNEYLVKYNTASGKIDMPGGYLYDSANVVICITNDDLRNKYYATVSVANLPPMLDAIELLDKARFGKVPTKEKGLSRQEMREALVTQLQDLELFVGVQLFASKISSATANDAISRLNQYSIGIISHLHQLQAVPQTLGTEGKSDKSDKTTEGMQKYSSTESQGTGKTGSPSSDGAQGEKSAAQADKKAEKSAKQTQELKDADDASSRGVLVKQESDSELIARAKKALRGIVSVRQYLQDAQHNLIRLGTSKDTRIEIAVFRTSTTTETDTDATSLRLVSTAAQRVASTIVESRSLSRFRLDAGLVYTGLVEETYQTGIGADGNRSIQVDSTAIPVIPMVFLSYYWKPTDPREVCPLSTAKDACPRANLLPTIALGVPLTRNPLEHFFVGTLWQPLPFFGFTAGVHIGQVNRLREGFQVGSAPPSNTGFADKDLTLQDFRVSYYVGAVITSDVFVKVLLKLLK